MKNLIVGLDPGLTTAVALLDFEGNLIALESRRDFSHADISKFIIGFGTSAIVSTDRNPAPKAVKRIGSSLKANILSPENNMRIVEKRKILKEYANDLKKGKVKSFIVKQEKKIKFGNRHEKDALAAAVFALRRMRPILNKRKQKGISL